jgi:hypothetical protein
MLADIAITPVTAIGSFVILVAQLVALFLLFAETGNGWFSPSGSDRSAGV